MIERKTYKHVTHFHLFTSPERDWHTYVVCILFECLFFLYDWITLVIKCAWPLYFADEIFKLISKISSQVRRGFGTCFAFTSSRSAGRTAILLDSLQGLRFSVIVCSVSLDPLYPTRVDARTSSFYFVKMKWRLVIWWGKTHKHLIRFD